MADGGSCCSEPPRKAIALSTHTTPGQLEQAPVPKLPSPKSHLCISSCREWVWLCPHQPHFTYQPEGVFSVWTWRMSVPKRAQGVPVSQSSPCPYRREKLCRIICNVQFWNRNCINAIKYVSWLNTSPLLKGKQTCAANQEIQFLEMYR